MGEYEVDEILNHRDVAESHQYFVSWKGYTESDNSWIREEDTNCEELLENYFEKIKAKKFKTKNLKNAYEVNSGSDIISMGKSIIEILDSFKNLDGTFYNVLLSDYTTATLTNEDVQKYSPNLLMEFLENKFSS